MDLEVLAASYTKYHKISLRDVANYRAIYRIRFSSILTHGIIGRLRCKYFSCYLSKAINHYNEPKVWIKPQHVRICACVFFSNSRRAPRLWVPYLFVEKVPMSARKITAQLKK